ncbi:hypothetical protein GCM10009809_08210 [Isoptericola hypogeus]|uniref:Uncharacterized protein n=1 Tax=Isoptericola hypogeus TaxID=300179 RepID=A0ABN2IYI3_9MICO
MTTTLDLQVASTYARMAGLGYRPAAPSDGFGNITVPLAELDLHAEAERYARAWLAQEHGQDFTIGCPSYEDRPALVLAIEAARVICGSCGDPRARAVAARLLRTAADEVDPVPPPEEAP